MPGRFAPSGSLLDVFGTVPIGGKTLSGLRVTVDKPAELPPLITAAQVEEHYGQKRRMMYGLVQHSALPPDVYVRNGRAILFIRKRLEAWLGLDGDSHER